ncbi:MAG TPA: hypothetical protein ENN41_09510, partial [Sediminispirochaeta sp.]|nr:hypothetical protein [Sediminispirochaeta sp.]
HVLHNYVRIVPTVRAAGGVYESSEFLVSFLLMIFSSMFIFQIFRLQNQNLRAIEKNAQEAQRSYRQLRNVLDRSAESFNVGERLWKYSRSNAQVAKTISEHLQEMQTEMEKLDENAAATRSGHDQILDKKEAVQRSMDRQTETIQDASASIEQIGSQVERTLTTTERKRAEVENLVQTADHAGGQINGTLESFHAISETSARIIEVIRVIEDVADRTNLLAMNAAIEAAHAGQAGRGFAIVASEIRGLAEETNEHSRTIRETMDQNRQLVEKAVREGDQLHAVFDEIRDKISGVQQSLLETIKGTSQLRSGHSQLQEVVKNLTLVNETVNESLETMDKNLLAGTESVSHIASAITEVRQKLNKLVGHTEEIIEVSSKLKEMGRENVDSYTNLQQEIGQIRN